uniref:Uncharacterized protein n=1 Tax=Syphacia muris TaxID=451379 RepID=A0A0N5ALW8_9BILA
MHPGQISKAAKRRAFRSNDPSYAGPRRNPARNMSAAAFEPAPTETPRPDGHKMKWTFNRFFSMRSISIDDRDDDIRWRMSAAKSVAFVGETRHTQNRFSKEKLP